MQFGSFLTLAAGVLGSVLLALLLPRGDVFSGTLGVMPCIVAALGVFEREAARRGARSLSAGDWGTTALGSGHRLSAAHLEFAATALLAAAALYRRQLGLEAAAPMIAAGLLVLLGQRVARQVVALRPLLGRRLPERPAVAFFLLPLLVYLAVMPWQAHQRPPDGDEPYYLLITHSLAFDLDADLTNNYADGDWRHFMDRPLEPQPGDPEGPGGELYSRHNEALPVILAPAYRLAGLWGALAMMAALTAALAWMTLRLAGRYFPDHPGEALLAWALLAFTPPLLLYAYQVWVEVPAALLGMVALDRILSFRHRPHWAWRPWLVVGLPVLLLPLVKIRFMLLAVPLVALAWWYAGRPRKPLIVITAALVLVGGGILVHNQLVFDNPLKIHHVEELELTQYPGAAYALGATGLFWDSAFGLFASAPLWLILLPALILAVARRSRALVDLLVFSGPYLAIVVPRNEWYGGWSPPFRYALVALPLLAVLLVPLLRHRRRAGARCLVAALGIATAGLTVLWILEPGWTYNFADGRTYLLDHLSRSLGADVARFFPSSVRPRAATWWWPAVTLVLVPLVWWWPRHRLSVARATAWGAAGLLTLTAALPWAAERLPTRRAELEDPWVRTTSGNAFPARWIIERTRYRGGWVLREGSTTVVPLVPGGERVRLSLVAKLIDNQPDRPLKLHLKAGDRRLGTWLSRSDDLWAEAHLGPVTWPAGAPLVLEVEGPDGPPPANGLVVDRVDMEWE